MAITSIQNFEDNYLIKNGEFINEDNLNRAVKLLKRELNEVSTGGADTLTLETFGIDASADEINLLAGAGLTAEAYAALTANYGKLQYLANVNTDIQNQINDLVQGAFEGTLSWQLLGLDAAYDETQLDWAASLYTPFNSAITSTEFSYLYGASSNIQTQLDTLSQAVSSLTGGGDGTTLADLGITTTATRINWLDSIYNSQITSDELGQLNGITYNIASKFSTLQAQVDGLSGGTAGVSSFNSRTGAVTLQASDITALGFSTGGVTSVNGSTGAVTLTASSINAVPNSSSISGTSVAYGLSGHGLQAQGSSVGFGGYCPSGGYAGITGTNAGASNHAVVGKMSGTSDGQTARVYAAFVAGDVLGGYWGSGFTSFTGLHDFFMDDQLTATPGDIMIAVDIVDRTLNDTKITVNTCTTANDKKVIGVLHGLSEVDRVEPEQGSNYYKMYGSKLDDLQNAVVNSLGEGGINVCEENGDIENGDYITSSNTPGKGMKQDDDLLHNYTVAKSLEDVVWADEVPGEDGCFEVNGVKCKLIGCTYHCG